MAENFSSESYTKDGKIYPERAMLSDGIKLSDKHIKIVGDTYTKYYIWRSYRSGLYLQFRNYNFDEYLRVSRELFWNSISTKSDDLAKLGMDLSLPFARKEAMDFLAKLTSLNVTPHLSGDDLDSLGLKVLQGIYKKWGFKSNDKVETFWDLLYGIVNGTVCDYIGYDNTEMTRRYLKSYDPQSGNYKIDTKKEKPYNDVCRELVPIEDVYIPKIYERNIQKQGRMLWKTQMEPADFYEEFAKYPLSKYVFPGMRIAEDSLYFRLLGGTGTSTARKIEVIREYDWYSDEFKIIAGGIMLNGLGLGDKYEAAPMPFDHKMAPFTWGINSPLDSKLAYGLSTTFQSKDPHKILNMFYCVTPDTKILTRDLHWVEAGTLKVGDKIIGFEEYSKKERKDGRRFLEDATVTATGRRLAPVYKVTLEDGTELKCTGNHRWLIHNWKGHGASWMRTDEMMEHLKDKKNGGQNMHFSFPKYFDVIEQDKDYDSGYLAGVYDGEGHLTLGKIGNGMQLTFSQQENPLAEKTREILKNKGYDFSIHYRGLQKGNIEPCNQTSILGGMAKIFKLLMQVRPERIIQERWNKKNLSTVLLKKNSLVDVISVEYIGEREIIELSSSSATYIAEGFGAHNTMGVERELRTIDPAILSSDIESPELIFGQHKVIPVNDVNAYKEFNLKDPSQQFFTMINSLQSNMTSSNQGGNAPVVPSKQPDSARAVMEDSQEKQQATANAVMMYYDLIRQKVLLVLKTALQFYTTDKYETADKDAIRTLLVSDMPLTLGGIGNLKIRIVKEKKTEMELFLEGIKESVLNGKTTEIVDVPIEFLQNLEFIIEKIDLEPDSPSELELATFVENVITPMLNMYVPMGLADPGKVMLRHMEKMGEAVSDYVSDANVSKVLGGQPIAPPTPPGGPTAQNGGQGNGAQTGNLVQSGIGIQNGANQSGPLKGPVAKFGNPKAKPLLTK